MELWSKIFYNRKRDPCKLKIRSYIKNKKMEEKTFEFWKVINMMDFNGRGYQQAGRWLVEDSGLTFSQIKEVRNMANRKVNALYSKFIDDPNLKIGSDDGFSDVLWQTVANGYQSFHNCTAESLTEMYNEMSYTESFAYAFHIVDEIEDEQFAANKFLKRARAEKRLEEIRRFGGGFQQKLLAAFEHADSNNRRKLAKGFPELFEHLVD